MADAKITSLDENTTPVSTDLLAIVDDPSGTAKTEKITLASLGIIDGWTPASETWEYASASTITVPSGAASKYAVGDRIKWTQTTVKYGVITAVADTVLTIAVNTDYTVANAAISANYYSHQSSPIGYPQWFALAAPTFNTGYIDDGSGGQPTISETRFSIVGRMCRVRLRGNGTKVTNDTNILVFVDTYFPLISRANHSGRSIVGTLAVYTNAGANLTNGHVLHYTNNTYYCTVDTAIADNTTINDFTIQILYEI